jgi:hypothetical protein
MVFDFAAYLKIKAIAFNMRLILFLFTNEPDLKN